MVVVISRVGNSHWCARVGIRDCGGLGEDEVAVHVKDDSIGGLSGCQRDGDLTGVGEQCWRVFASRGVVRVKVEAEEKVVAARRDRLR